MFRLPVLPAEPPSASRVGLAMRCAYPWTSGHRFHVCDAGPEAQLGTVVHGAAERAVRWNDEPDDLSAIPEADRETARDLIEVVRAFIADERGRPHALYAAEVPVEIDVATGEGRVLPSAGHRDYSARSPRGLAGTADHVLWPEGEQLVARDWKTGRQLGLAREGARMQVRTLAVSLAAVYNVDEVVVEVASITGAGVDVRREELDRDALQEHMDTLRVLAVKLTSGPRRPSPGPWCVEMFCPMLGNCPASRGALEAVTQQPAVLEIGDDATALRVIDALPRARAALASIEEALDVYLRKSPPQGPDGRRYGYQEHERRDVVVRSQEHLAALEAVLGPHVRDAVEVKTSTSIAAIERAARRMLAADGKTRGIAALRDRAVEALAAVGGVRVNKYAKPAWFRPEQIQHGEAADDLAATEGDDHG